MSSDPFLIAVGIIGTRDLTDELLNEVMGMLPKVTLDLEVDALTKVRKQLEAIIGISMVTGQGLHGGEQEPWLDEVKTTIKWTYWDAYSHELKSNGFGKEVIRVLDEDTHNILNECGNPSVDVGWRVQGLVMGDVQSGKTANYCGLVNKAADAGYKFVVLLTGMIEELRAQSQERLDSGFVGRDSRSIFEGEREKKPIGSGRFRSVVPNVLTSIDFDFLTANKKVLGGIPLENISEPVLLVMKKHRSPLQNLISFLDSQMSKGNNQLALPFLLIDDEADNASVNSKKDEDPATINKLIREVLRRFGRSTYVAYTATPFANVFINPDYDDLFPSNFVYSLNTPTNYIGASSIFTESGIHQYQVQDITDADTSFPYKHRKDQSIHSLPESLCEAIETFLLSSAIRDLRKEPLRHRSMLVNVTRFTDVQGRLSDLIKNYLYALTEEIKQYLSDDDLWAKHLKLKSLHATWQLHYAESEVSWDAVRKVLYESIASIKVLTINQKSEAVDRLNYKAYEKSEKGRRVIAVGGLTLSRGLTLYGLSVSYFYRNSKAYDTLLQMGRWFGYRTGYEDVCRIWMDPDVQEWFSHVANVVGELKLDIRRMHANRQPPSRFGMKVRSHPDALIVTALNKMRNAQEVEVDVSYSACGAETPFLPKNTDANEKNLASVNKFLSGLPPAQTVKNKCIWKNVSATQIAGFLHGLEISSMNMPFMTDITGRERPILSFISGNEIERLATWDVCLPQGEGAPISGFVVRDTNGATREIKPRNRQFEKIPAGSDYLKLNKQRVGEIADETVALEKRDIEQAQKDWEEERKEDPEKGETVPGSLYRRYRERPLLTIHLIEPKDPKDVSKRKDRMMMASDIESKVLVAVGLSFPQFEDEDKSARVPYRLNKVALRAMGLINDQEDEDDED
ncbi:Z1 domain-containing protein [Roseateles oligotrophus]|uniref:Z1 domain-containing protein n=1 Tax=Roseateles oligotrophus TaxID=1769250 RepID=A0ABT2YC99_9BURK|nr:Z1 domain-containing protein [Roseateles oligotrophus]MCV2367671.1 Z1 domain-containing protein [Roseateles oligotrophus]